MMIYAEFGECESGRTDSCPWQEELISEEVAEAMNVAGIDIEMNERLI